MPDVVVRAYLALPPQRLRLAITKTGLIDSLFEGLTLRLSEDRGRKGWRWQVAEPFSGSAEIWLEPALSGCVLHAFLRTAQLSGRRLYEREMGMRSLLFAFKDDCESAES